MMKLQPLYQKFLVAAAIYVLAIVVMAGWVRDIAQTNRSILNVQKQTLDVLKATTQPTTQPHSSVN